MYDRASGRYIRPGKRSGRRGDDATGVGGSRIVMRYREG